MSVGDKQMVLSFEQVCAARERQAPYVRHTPTEHSPDLSGIVGREVYLKLENVQRTGAFKIRGAISRLLTIDPHERARGAKLLGAPATVVLPVSAPLAKIAAIQRHGAHVVLEGASYDAAHAHALSLATERR